MHESYADRREDKVELISPHQTQPPPLNEITRQTFFLRGGLMDYLFFRIRALSFAAAAKRGPRRSRRSQQRGIDECKVDSRCPCLGLGFIFIFFYNYRMFAQHVISTLMQGSGG